MSEKKRRHGSAGRRGRALAGMAAALVAALGFLAAIPCAARAESVEQQAQVCSACHGANGVPTQPLIPVIWGQQAGYLFIELRDFKSGARKNELMSPIAQGLSQSALLPLAEYFAQKKWPDLQQPAASAALAAQAQTVNASVVCTSCHQQGFLGAGTQPRLAGQVAGYLKKTMTEFRTGARGNNPGMTDLMKAVTEPDIAALTAFLAAL
jgi:cytochrome c553